MKRSTKILLAAIGISLVLGIAATLFVLYNLSVPAAVQETMVI